MECRQPKSIAVRMPVNSGLRNRWIPAFRSICPSDGAPFVSGTPFRQRF
jgi:hypothetical protein